MVGEGLVFRNFGHRRVRIQGAEKLDYSAFLSSTDQCVLRLADEADDTRAIRVLGPIRLSDGLDRAERYNAELTDLEVVRRAVAVLVTKTDVQLLTHPVIQALVVGFANRGQVCVRHLRDRIVGDAGLPEDLEVLAPAAGEHAVGRRR